MVAQEDPPLAVRRDRRRLREDLRDREPVLPAHRHEDPRHQREMEGHVALVAAGRGFTEVLHHVGRPLVGLREQHPPGVLVVNDLAAAPEEGVRLRQVLAVGALALVEVRHGVQPEPVDPEVQPEPQHVDHRVLHGEVVEVEVRLMGEEPVPVELPADRVVGPVRLLGVHEDDPGLGIAGVVVRPDIKITVGAVRMAPGLLEPRVGVTGVVHHQVGDHPDPPLVRFVQQHDEVLHRAELGQHRAEVPDVVPAVAQRRVVDRWQPQTVDTEPGEVVELLGQPPEVAGAVPGRVVERPDQHLVEDGSLEPVAVDPKLAGVGEVLGLWFGELTVLGCGWVGFSRHPCGFPLIAVARVVRDRAGSALPRYLGHESDTDSGLRTMIEAST